MSGASKVYFATARARRLPWNDSRPSRTGACSIA
jgi:hypothetical protein